jgi:hypothetical protein
MRWPGHRSRHRVLSWTLAASGLPGWSCVGQPADSARDPVASEARTPQAVPMPIPVLELRYFPTSDGVTLDPKETTYDYSLQAIRARVQELSGQLTEALERGSTYVRDPSRIPSTTRSRNRGNS